MARIETQEAEKMLSDVPSDYVFRLNDGRILKNMKELEEAFFTMSDETFAYHSNKEKKDFSNWVKDIIKDERLARDLSKAKTRDEAARKVTDRVVFLSKRLYS